MREVIQQLEHIRRRSRAMLLGQRLAVIVAWIIAIALVLIGMDYLLRLPGIARLVLLLGGAGALGWALWTYFRPAVRFRPGLTDLALRAEATFPSVAGRLASSVEFAAAGTDKTNPLAARSVLDTERRLTGEALSRVISGDRTWRSTGVMIGVLAVAATCIIVYPTAAGTGLARLFAPFGATEWPARTGVVSLMHEVVGENLVHPRGQALPLRARVTKGEPDYVVARYRLEMDGDWEAWNRIVLTDQGGHVHERLVDTTADAIDFYFETRDASTKRERITLAAPPAVLRASLTVTPPSYAGAWFSPLEADLGPGLDERAITETPSLVGSDVTLVLEFNKPIPLPEGGQTLRELLGWDATEPPGSTVHDVFPTIWTLRWRLSQSRTLNLQLVDEHGLTNNEPIAYRIEAVEDRLPSVTIMEPESDEPVLPTAVVRLVAEARDDVAVSTIGLEANVQGGDSTGETQPDLMWEMSDWLHANTGTIEAELDLAQHELVEGDTVLVRGVAGDVFELDGLRHPAVRSPARRLRVISELELARRFRRELGVVRQNAIRIEARQAELEDDVISEGPQPGVERAQAQIAERIAAQREVLRQVAGRMQMNRLDDEQLGSLVQQAGDLLDFAGRAANRAVESVEKAQTERRPGVPGVDRSEPPVPPVDTPGGPPVEPAASDQLAAERAADPFGSIDDLDEIVKEPAEADRPIVDAQREVREELTDLITLLDRDEDTWVATRRLEELMQSQTELEAGTAATGRRTLGRSWDELTAGEQSDLQRMAERQSDLAEEARQLIEDLRRRAEELEEVDPQGAEAMRQAADSGEQRELSRDMENASERVGRNQMRTAAASQQGARQTLQEMVRDMRETSRASAEELLRRLASLIESIERLVTVQQNELAGLERSIETGSFAGRDRGMIRLAQNTQTVAAEARTAGQESRRVARLLDRAADAQGSAVMALRAMPVEAEEALEAENRSLDLLREARALAEELEQAVEQRELMRQRGELIAAYREFAEREIALRGETIALVENRPLDRRGLIEARGQGRIQDEIRVGLDDLRVSTPEVLDSAVFSHVHERMDDWARDVIDALVAGEVSDAVTGRQQRIADSIGRLIEAMEDLVTPPDKFAGDQQQGGAGGTGSEQQPPLIPPMAELMLLRGMQEQLYDQTRVLDDQTDVEPGERRSRLAELGEEQRELLDLGRQMAESLQGDAPPPPTPDG